MGGVVRYLYRSSLPMHLCPTRTILVAGPYYSMAWGPPEINPPDLSMPRLALSRIVGSPMLSNLVLSLSNLVLSDALFLNWPIYI